MPHIFVEYTDNIQDEADIKGLLRKINGVLIDQGGVFPIGGIRSRAVMLTDFCVADGSEDDAFVHVTLKIGGGRSAEAKAKVCDEMFAMIKGHFSGLFARRFLALSLELYEFDEGSTFKQNNIHARYKK